MDNNSSYKFINPGFVKILTRLENQQAIFKTQEEIWRWSDGGTTFTINWERLDFHSELKEYLKGYLHHRLEVNSPHTVGGFDLRFIKTLQRSSLSKYLPWHRKDIEKFLKCERPHEGRAMGMRTFYSWALAKASGNFDPETNLFISEFKSQHSSSSYEDIFLRQNVITPNDETRLVKYLNNPIDFHDRMQVQRNVILHLAFEVAPRPIQIYSLNEEDFSKVSTETTDYYAISLPMAKKIRTGLPEKRARSISSSLGKKIEILIKLNGSLTLKEQKGLFLNTSAKNRLSSSEISSIISDDLRKLGFEKGDSLNLLRHHLGQSLADQGASAEIIAEIMGHNTTVAARAYVGATPEIATIKAKALGKNGTYLDIMQMLITGEIIEKGLAPKDRWIKGMVGNQYIGGIGSCGLPTSSSCPKNPVYSCYTCSKFHPFVDGTHTLVKNSLQAQAQFFIDTSEKALLLENNRTVIQLETTINAVEAVIEKCNIQLKNSGNEI